MSEPAAWYGKMPALGDFASRRLDADWIHAWDDWLQRELVRSRAALGDDAWLDAYLVAPLRRFWLAPGLMPGPMGRDAWLGVLMPSVDGVGRHFPFTLTAALASGHDQLIDALAATDWLDAADALARQVLDPGFGVEALEAALPDLPALHGERRGETHAGMLLAQQLRSLHPHARCVWWCEGAERVPQFLCTEALPAGAAFDALLRDGG